MNKKPNEILADFLRLTIFDKTDGKCKIEKYGAVQCGPFDSLIDVDGNKYIVSIVIKKEGI